MSTSGGFPAEGITMEKLVGNNQNYYNSIWKKYSDSTTGVQKMKSSVGVNLFKSSGLSEHQLREIWELADYLNTGNLDQKGFFLALHLIALAQNGKPAIIKNITALTPPPRLKEFPDTMTILEWSEFERNFNELPLQDGFVSGSAVKPIMLASGLPPQELAQIWQTVDTDSDGKLRSNEFCVAMYLIKHTKNGGVAPVNLPPSIFMRPVSVVPTTPSLNSSLPPLPSQSSGTSADLQTDPARRGDIMYTTQESINKYQDTFKRISKTKEGLITGTEGRDIFKLSKLPVADLAHIWNLSSRKQSGYLDLEEFCLAMYLIESKLHGGNIPATLNPGACVVVRSANERSTTPDLGLPPSYDAIKVLDTQENEIKELTDQNDQLKSDIQNAETSISEKQAEIAVIQRQLVEATTEKSELERAKASLTTRAGQVDQEHYKLVQTIQDVTRRCSQEKDEIASLEQQLLERENAFKQKQNEMTDIKNELDESKEKQLQLEIEVRERKSTIEDITAEIEKTQREVSEIQRKNQSLISEQSDLSSKLSSLTSTHQQMKDQSKIVNIAEKSLLPEDMGMTREGDVLSMRATDGSSPVSSLSNFSASSVPHLDDRNEDNDFNNILRSGAKENNNTNNHGIMKIQTNGDMTSDLRAVKFADQQMMDKPAETNVPTDDFPFGEDFFATAPAPATNNQQSANFDFFSTLDPFKSDSSAATTNPNTYDPFSSDFSTAFFNTNTQQNIDATDSAPPVLSTDNPFADIRDPFTGGDANTDSFSGQVQKGFDNDPFNPPQGTIEEPQNISNTITNDDADPFGTNNGFHSDLFNANIPAIEVSDAITDPFNTTTTTNNTTTTNTSNDTLASNNYQFSDPNATGTGTAFGSLDPFNDNSDPFTSNISNKSEFDNADPFTTNNWPATDNTNPTTADPFETDPF